MSSRIAAYIRQHHLALVAIFFAVSGTAYAVDGPLPGQNQVGSEDIIDAEVKTQDVANNAIGTGKIPDGAVRSADVANDTTDFGLTAADLEAGSVGTSEVANGSLTGADVQNSSLTGSDIATGSLTGSDIADTNSLGGAEIDESDLDVSSLGVFAVDDGQDENECEGVLPRSSFEVCVDVFVTLSQPSRILIIATGAWSKLEGDAGLSRCRLDVNDVPEPGSEMFMGDNTGFGGGHRLIIFADPFTLNATTNVLPAGNHDIELKCQDQSEGGQGTFIESQHMSALAIAE
jgi:hypothetical protein